MYCAYDQKENIIAWHDKKSVVEKYIGSIYELHKIELSLGKIKKSSEYKALHKDDLYLIRYGNTYIQSGYLMYVELAEDKLVEDDQYALDILYRLLETARLTKKQTKKIVKAIKVMEKVVRKDKEYIPSFEQLKIYKMDYDPYLYNTGLIDKYN